MGVIFLYIVFVLLNSEVQITEFSSMYNGILRHVLLTFIVRVTSPISFKTKVLSGKIVALNRGLCWILLLTNEILVFCE